MTKTSTAAMTASAPAPISTAATSGTNQRNSPLDSWVTSRNTTCSANQTARLRMTPTTAAVIAASAPASGWLRRRSSMNGAPAKIQRNDGANTVQVAIAAPSTPASTGLNGAGERNAAIKLTNCVTRINGP